MSRAARRSPRRVLHANANRPMPCGIASGATFPGAGPDPRADARRSATGRAWAASSTYSATASAGTTCPPSSPPTSPAGDACATGSRPVSEIGSPGWAGVRRHRRRTPHADQPRLVPPRSRLAVDLGLPLAEPVHAQPAQRRQIPRHRIRRHRYLPRKRLSFVHPRHQ